MNMKVGNYEFTLKNFQYLESRSEETHCFGAMLYLNGKKFANCGNSGHGGSTDIHFLPECRELGEQVEAFLKTQPKIKFDDSDFEMDFNLEYIVDTLVEKLLEAKEHQKIMNKTKKSLVFRENNGNHVILGWKNATIEGILKNPKGSIAIKQTIAEQIAKGHILVNENIPPELLPGQTQ